MTLAQRHLQEPLPPQGCWIGDGEGPKPVSDWSRSKKPMPTCSEESTRRRTQRKLSRYRRRSCWHRLMAKAVNLHFSASPSTFLGVSAAIPPASTSASHSPIRSWKSCAKAPGGWAWPARASRWSPIYTRNIVTRVTSRASGRVPRQGGCRSYGRWNRSSPLASPTPTRRCC